MFVKHTLTECVCKAQPALAIKALQKCPTANKRHHPIRMRWPETLQYVPSRDSDLVLSHSKVQAAASTTPCTYPLLMRWVNQKSISQSQITGIPFLVRPA